MLEDIFKRITVTLPKSLHKSLKEKAYDADRTINEVAAFYIAYGIHRKLTIPRRAK